MARPQVIRDEENKRISKTKRLKTEKNPNGAGRSSKQKWDLTANDIIDIIYQSGSSSLTKAEMREAIYVFCEQIVKVFTMDDVPLELNVSIPSSGKPSLGSFRLKKCRGMVKGDTYKRPINFTNEMQEFVCEEDKGDYLQLYFDMNKALRDRVKDKTRREDLKRRKNGK